MTSSDNHTFVLGVDLDGVVGDYEHIFRLVVADEEGRDPDLLGPQTHWGFGDSGWPIRDEDHYLELHRRGIAKHKMFAEMLPVAGASDALWRLSDAGVHIRIVTHRLYVNWDHESVVAQTVGWLQSPRQDGRPLIPYRDLCFMGDKTDVGADLYVDDAPHNIAALRANHADVICFDRLYNRNIPGLRAANWDEVERIVMDRVAERGITLHS
jgi:5'(3')-deoxyribonucleotidase